jgi:organic radical activating enzyme
MALRVATEQERKLDVWRRKLFAGGTTPRAFRDLLPRMREDGKRSVGRLRPWAWWVEITRGCNLRCGFCATRLFPSGEFSFMSIGTWRDLLDVVQEVSPLCRLEIGNAGEPTLHPRLPYFLREARERVPRIQLLMFTNGTTLIDGRTTYRELFEAGLNMAFVDMYAPRERHVALAEASGYQYIEQASKPKDAVNVFAYQGDPDVHVIQLSEQPGNWPRRKVNRGAFSTFFNHLDWEAAKEYGLAPVTDPPARRCDLPAKFANVYYDGSYSFCCFDFAREVAGTLGNVSEGMEGFLRFWLGRYMQDCRRRLHRKDRASHPMCRRCAFTSIRGDIPWWPGELLEDYWTGRGWERLEEGEG